MAQKVVERFWTYPKKLFLCVANIKKRTMYQNPSPMYGNRLAGDQQNNQAYEIEELYPGAPYSLCRFSDGGQCLVRNQGVTAPLDERRASHCRLVARLGHWRQVYDAQ